MRKLSNYLHYQRGTILLLLIARVFNTIRPEAAVQMINCGEAAGDQFQLFKIGAFYSQRVSISSLTVVSAFAIPTIFQKQKYIVV